MESAELKMKFQPEILTPHVAFRLSLLFDLELRYAKSRDPTYK